MDELGGVTANGSRFRILLRDCEAYLARDLAAKSVGLVVSGPPFFKAGMAYEPADETWDEHWDKRRAMLDGCVRALRPGGRLALHLADCPNFEWHTGITEEKLVPAVYADYLRREHDVALSRRFIWVQPEPWTHYQHAKRLALPDGGCQLVVDAESLTEAAGGPRPQRTSEQARLGWEYILVFRKPGAVTELDLREFACLGWQAAFVASGDGQAGRLQDLPPVSDEERAWQQEAVWRFPSDEALQSPPKPDHPCPWPVALPERLIRLYSSPGDWVLDPYLGSGAAIEAALRQGRNVVGYEAHPAYAAQLRARFAGEAVAETT